MAEPKQTLTLYRPTSSTSEAEKIKIITDLHDFFAGTQSYLDSLFTLSMAAWVENRIKDDSCPDLYHWYSQTIDEAEKARVDFRAEIAAVNKDNKKYERQLEDAEKRVTELQTKLTTDHAIWLAEREQWNRMTDELRGDKVNLATEARNLHDTVTEQADEIIRLKAKLWDLTQSK